MVIIIVIYRQDLSRIEIHFHRRVSCFSDWWGVAVTNFACLTEQDYPRTLNRLQCFWIGGSRTEIVHTFFFYGATAPSGPGPPHYRGFTIALSYTTLGRTLLDECPMHTTHNTHKRRKFMPPAVFEPTIPVSEQPQTHTLDRAAAGNYVQWFVSQI
jgi:hypothetical protein